MKKIIAMILSLIMVLSLTACGSSAPAATEAPAADTFKVAIIQQLDHSSLDEIRNAIEAQLTAVATEKGVTIEFTYDNGQNQNQRDKLFHNTYSFNNMLIEFQMEREWSVPPSLAG